MLQYSQLSWEEVISALLLLLLFPYQNPEATLGKEGRGRLG